MPRLYKKSTDEFVFVPASQAEELLASGDYELAGDRATAIAPSGARVTGSAEVIGESIASGSLRPETEAARDVRAEEQRRERTYGGPVGAIAAGGAGLARGLTLSGSDWLIGALGGEDALRGYREVNPTLSLLTELGGATVPAFFTGGASAGATAARGASILARTPAGAAIRIGESLATRGVGRGALAKAGQRAIGYGTEGAIFGAGEAGSELALSEDPVDAETAISTLSSRALFGAGIGAGIGGGTSLLGDAFGVGMRRARKVLEDIKARRAAGEASEDVADLAKLDRKGLREAEKAEKARVREAVDEEAKDVVEELKAYKEFGEENKPWLLGYKSKDKGLKQASAISYKADRRIRSMLNDPEGLAKRPDMTLRALRETQLALSEFAAEGRRLRETMGELYELKGEGGKGLGKDFRYAVHRREPDGTITLRGEDGKSFISDVTPERLADEFVPAVSQRVQWGEAAEEMVERNKRIQEQIEDLAQRKKEPSSPRLDAIQDALLGISAPKSLAQRMGEGAATAGIAGATSFLPMGGNWLLGAWAAQKLGNLVFRRMAKANAHTSERLIGILDSVFGKAGKVKAPIPSVATRVLQRVAYAPEGQSSVLTRATVPAATKLHELYREREKEIRSQVTVTPEGPRMRPEARRKLGEELEPVRVVNPILADRMESAAARRLEYLASRLPRRPDSMAMPIGPDRWQPSEMELRRFARAAYAVEDPIEGVLARVLDGSIIPDDADALRSVYPELYARVGGDIVERLATQDRALSYKTRLALSILLDRPLDPLLHPTVIRALQANFAAEPGTEGGTVPPTPQPAFGSLSKTEPTPGQERAAG